MHVEIDWENERTDNDDMERMSMEAHTSALSVGEGS